MNSRSWTERAWAVFEKDLRAELRTRYALNAILIFSLSSLVSVSLSLAGARPPAEIQSALLWILLFFAAMAGLARGFVHEEERQTSPWLKLSATPAMVFCGKFLYNLALLVLVEAVTVPLFLGLMNVQGADPPLFLATLLLGTFGLAGAGTLIAAIVARTQNRGALFAALAFPILLPVLVTGTVAMRTALSGGTVAASWGELRVLLSYALVVFTGGLILFDFVWSD